MSLSPPPSREKLPVDTRTSSAEMPRVWLKWLNELRELVLNTAAGIANWEDLNFSSSSLADIQTRNHGDLQNLNTPDNAHLYLSDRDALVGGGVTTLHKHRLNGYTVATLPAGTAGDKAYVTDATAPTWLGALTGGGSVVCPVFYNGTDWKAG